jgi:N-acetyl sugar amidotransferase
MSEVTMQHLVSATGAYNAQNKEGYQICSRSVMDNMADPNIRFDKDGVCNYWGETEEKMKSIRLSPEQVEKKVSDMLQDIKRLKGSGQYDCLIGVSGGVDSSYLAYLVHEWKLKPLVVHFDNGWNSELAVSNIHNIVTILGFDLMTYVIDWEEFRDLQRAFFRASVIDIEVLTDHAITAAMFRIARENKIKVILGGSNIATESFFPSGWSWNKQDLVNIRSIHKKFGELPLKTFPTLSTLRRNLLQTIPGLGLKFHSPLNYINYRKDEAMKVLEEKLDWRYYGGKHYESVFTKFYQAYYLPEKFGVDKRRPHLSCVIMNGEMTRDEAITELSQPLYKPEELESEKSYVLKKLGFSEMEWEKIMKTPPALHTDYDSDYFFLQRIKHVLGTLSKIRRSVRAKTKAA